MMIEVIKSKRRLLVFLVITAAIIAGGGVYFYTIPMNGQPLRKTTAFVIGKAQVHVKEWDSRFSSKSDNWQAGYEEYRVYFAIDDFPQIDESLRSAMLEQEGRLSGENARYRIKDKILYEKTKVGDKMVIAYQIVGHGKIDIIGAFLPEEIQK